MQKDFVIKVVFGLVIILVIFMAGVYSQNYLTGQTIQTGRASTNRLVQLLVQQ